MSVSSNPRNRKTETKNTNVQTIIFEEKKCRNENRETRNYYINDNEERRSFDPVTFNPFTSWTLKSIHRENDA